jgi:hypothetical protein
MIAAPWYLLSAGIVVLLAGYFLAALVQPPKSKFIDPKMTDDEIVQSLESQDEGNWTGLVILAGYALIGISLIWRLIRLIF